MTDSPRAQAYNPELQPLVEQSHSAATPSSRAGDYYSSSWRIYFGGNDVAAVSVLIGVGVEVGVDVAENAGCI